MRALADPHGAPRTSERVATGPPVRGGDLARTHVPMWAITGKQCWRCGVLRERIYRTRVLAHTQIPQRMLLALDSRTVAMKVGTR